MISLSALNSQTGAPLKKEANIQSVQKVAIAILHYLRDYPFAKDTVEGIAKWWIRDEIEVVEGALELLMDEGVLEKHEQIYQLAHHRKSFARITIDETLLRLTGN